MVEPPLLLISTDLTQRYQNACKRGCTISWANNQALNLDVIYWHILNMSNKEAAIIFPVG